MTKFSIFLPVRNGWPYVRECVESILGQSYPNFELVVLDNQSTDGTLPWLQGLTDERVRVLTSSSSLSIVDSWARIKGVEKQEFMTLIGHDDILGPEFLMTIKGLIERYPNAALYQTGSRLINSEGNTIRSCRPVPERETAVEYLAARFAFNRDIFGTGYVMRSLEYERLGGIPPFERLFFADDALWLSMMRCSYKISDPAEHFAVRVHSRSESASLPSVWSSILKGLNQFTEFLHDYIKEDAEVRAITETHEPAFLLTYHRNVLIYALVEACAAGRIIDSEVTKSIELSLASSAPSVAGDLHTSPKVRIIEMLNASPLRAVIPLLWHFYYKMKNRG